MKNEKETLCIYVIMFLQNGFYVEKNEQTLQSAYTFQNDDIQKENNFN